MPLTLDQKRTYIKSFNAVLRRAAQFQNGSVDGVLQILKDYRLQVVDIISNSQGWNIYWAQQMKQEIDREMRNLTNRLTLDLQTKMDSGFKLGQDFITEPLKQIGLTSTMYGISAEDLSIAHSIAADLVTDIAQASSKSIAKQIEFGIMGNKTQTDIIKRIGQVILSDTARQGAPQSTFKTLADRAEAIWRTETGRVLDMGHYAQGKATVDIYPGLKKYWIATFDNRARKNHINMDMQTNPEHGGIPIRFDKLFVFGPNKDDKGRMPHDAQLAAKHTVSCRCTMATTLLEKEDYQELYPNASPPDIQ